MRILAISDIHGQSSALDKLLNAAKYEPSTDKLFFCGDYIGKGPDSEGVLNRVMAAVQQGAKAILGNHEYDYLQIDEKTFDEEKHSFLQTLPYYTNHDGYLFVHAGIRAKVPIEHQQHEDLIRIREGFLDYANDFNGYVVFGHTPTDRLHGQVGKIWLHQNKIGIDTGAGQNQYLSLVDLTNNIQHRISLVQWAYEVIKY